MLCRRSSRSLLRACLPTLHRVIFRRCWQNRCQASLQPACVCSSGRSAAAPRRLARLTPLNASSRCRLAPVQLDNTIRTSTSISNCSSSSLTSSLAGRMQSAIMTTLAHTGAYAKTLGPSERHQRDTRCVSLQAQSTSCSSCSCICPFSLAEGAPTQPSMLVASHMSELITHQQRAPLQAPSPPPPLPGLEQPLSPASDDSSYLAVPLVRPQHAHRRRATVASPDILPVYGFDAYPTVMHATGAHMAA
jgi:hypothetical protein